MAKTKTRTSGRISNRFWKLLGASTDRDQAQSMEHVHESAEFDEKAADLDDAELREATQLLRLEDLADSADIPQFLAIAREASPVKLTSACAMARLRAARREGVSDAESAF